MVAEPSNGDGREFSGGPVSGGQGGDLDQVVGEDPLSGPGFRSFEAVQAGAVPAVSAFEGADPAFASGSPFDGSAECSACSRPVAGRHRVCPLRGMTTVRTPRSARSCSTAASPYPRSAVTVPGCATGPGFDPVDRGRQLWCIGGVSGLHVVIDHDAVVVVDDLPLVTELDGFPSRPLAIGRASRSCRLTTRVAPSGVIPAIRCRACPMILAVASSRSDR